MALLLDFGADINTKNYYKSTHLHIKCVKLLLEAKTNFNIKDRSHRIPSLLAKTDEIYDLIVYY
jgi:hypothetical protein